MKLMTNCNATRLLAAATALLFSVALPAPPAHAQAGQPAGAAAEAAEMAAGEIRKVDKEAGKITIRHGELKNLAMPPMTMVFVARDAAMLDLVKAGDKVNFVADKVGGQFTVMKLEVVR